MWNQNGKAATNSIKEAIRIKDGIKYEKQQLQKKLGDRGDMINIDARNIIPANKTTASVVKCANRHDHNGAQDAFINNNIAEECCPRCNKIETCEHAVKGNTTKTHRKEFVEKLLEEMLENKPKPIVVVEIFDIIEDILRCIEEDEENEYETNQEMIRF